MQSDTQKNTSLKPPWLTSWSSDHWKKELWLWLLGAVGWRQPRQWHDLHDAADNRNNKLSQSVSTIFIVSCLSTANSLIFDKWQSIWMHGNIGRVGAYVTKILFLLTYYNKHCMQSLQTLGLAEITLEGRPKSGLMTPFDRSCMNSY